MYRIAKTLSLAAAALLICATSALGFEAQGWKSGQIHLHETFPLDMFQRIDTVTTVPVTVLLHNQPPNRHLSFVDLQDQGTTLSKVTTNVFGDGSAEQRLTVNLTLDPSRFAHSGYQEVRIRPNIDRDEREFDTTRACLFIVNGKSRSDYCGGPTVRGRCGAGAWYPDLSNNYRIVFVDCRDVARAQAGPLPAGYKVRVKFQDGTGLANVDPHFHAGDPGVVLATSLPKNTWTTVTVPDGLAPGAHKLHLRSQTGEEAGAYVMDFTTA